MNFVDQHVYDKYSNANIGKSLATVVDAQKYNDIGMSITTASGGKIKKLLDSTTNKKKVNDLIAIDNILERINKCTPNITSHVKTLWEIYKQNRFDEGISKKELVAVFVYLVTQDKGYPISQKKFMNMISEYTFITTSRFQTLLKQMRQKFKMTNNNHLLTYGTGVSNITILCNLWNLPDHFTYACNMSANDRYQIYNIAHYDSVHNDMAHILFWLQEMGMDLPTYDENIYIKDVQTILAKLYENREKVLAITPKSRFSISNKRKCMLQFINNIPDSKKWK